MRGNSFDGLRATGCVFRLALMAGLPQLASAQASAPEPKHAKSSDSKVQKAPLEPFVPSPASARGACSFKCEGKAIPGTELESVAAACQKKLAAEDCALSGPVALNGLELPTLEISLTNVDIGGGLDLSGSSIRRLEIAGGTIGCAVLAEDECQLDLSRLKADSIVIRSGSKLSYVRWWDGCARDPEIELLRIVPRLDLSSAELKGDLELRGVDVRNGIDASDLRVAGVVTLSSSELGCYESQGEGACISFHGAKARAFESNASHYRSSASFFDGTADSTFDFSCSKFDWTLEAGLLKAEKAVSFRSATFPGAEALMASRDGALTECGDSGKGASIELYSMVTPELDLRGIQATSRIVNLGGDRVTLLETGDARACGLLMSSASITAWRVDEPNADNHGIPALAATSMDLRAAEISKLLSRGVDPVNVILRTFERADGATQLLTKFERQLRDSGQIEPANQVYVATRRKTWADSPSVSEGLFLLTGDGRYPLPVYGAAFMIVWVLARWVFRRRPPRWYVVHPNLEYSAWWFALDVITPSLLDLGYRGIEVFDDKRAARWHSVLHVTGLLVLATLTVAIGVRIP